ncbi:MAG: alpha/beta hydrolase [Betaproteobacteria bacterium]|nr:MAG: alpha/beta hydrolase [Betaproteobacteria bacterium]
MESLLVSFLKIAAAVAVGLPLVVYLAQDSLIFYRQPLPEARRAQIARQFPAAQEFALAVPDGTRLHGWLVRPQEAKAAPLVLYFGGNAEEVSWMLEAVGEPARGETPGAAWLLVNYRGYGASEGAPSEHALVADALALYDHARRLHGVDAERIFAFGRSLGSGVAVALAAARPLRGLVLVSPFDSLTAVAKHYYPYLPVDWLLRHPFDSIGRAPALKTPLLCLIAERDEVIPAVHAERLYAAWGGPKRKVLLGGANHNSSDGSAGFWPSIRAFLEGAR